MARTIKISRGANLSIIGEAALKVEELEFNTVSIKPEDFFALTPKLVVKQGDEVKAGSPLFYNKLNPHVNICSPVSGEVVEIVRGDKRKLLEVKILKDSNTQYLKHDKIDLAKADNIAIRKYLLNGGVWPFIKQRPYDVVANPTDVPKSIFISAFDSNPLAGDAAFMLQNEQDNIQLAIDALAKLTPGKVYLGIHASQQNSFFNKLKNVVINVFDGPHPAGNVGVQIHHLDPINRGEKVWIVGVHHLPIIGRLINSGVLDAQITFAATGSEVKAPQYYKAVVGASIEQLAKQNVKNGVVRYISGNVLTGSQIASNGALGFYDNQLTVIPEGHYSEFFGWLSFSPKKLSFSRAFTSWLAPNSKFNVDTNNHGEDRAFVITGQYERFIPMDIYPMQLLKSILVEDIEQMEQLGIYEVAPEDFALAEFACTSKQPLQETIKRGLETMIKEVG